MTLALARDSLTVFIDGEEVPGLIVYGLFTLGSRRDCIFPSDAWIAGPEVEEFSLHGEGWEVLTWDVPIVLWPNSEQLRAAVHASLRAMIASEGRVAWVGAEGLPYCDPPELFSPECMSGGVLAWMTDSGDFGCPLQPDAPLSPVSDDVLLRLRHHAQGLADAR